MSERTLENAMAHAELQRKRNDAGEGLDCAEFDLVLLADEVAHLKRQRDSIDRAMKMRDTFFRGDAAAVAYRELCYFLEPCFTGAQGREMTVSEAIQMILDIANGGEEAQDKLERLQKEIASKAFDTA